MYDISFKRLFLMKLTNRCFLEESTALLQMNFHSRLSPWKRNRVCFLRSNGNIWRRISDNWEKIWSFRAVRGPSMRSTCTSYLVSAQIRFVVLILMRRFSTYPFTKVVFLLRNIFKVVSTLIPIWNSNLWAKKRRTISTQERKRQLSAELQW